MIIIVAFPFGWSGQVRILEYYTAPFEVAVPKQFIPL